MTTVTQHSCGESGVLYNIRVRHVQYQLGPLTDVDERNLTASIPQVAGFHGVYSGIRDQRT